MPDTETKPEMKDGQQGAGSASGDSATEKKETPLAGAERSSGAEKRTDKREAEKKRTFFQARQERKQSLEEQIKALGEKIESLTGTREVTQRTDGRKSILDVEDPDEHLDHRYGAPLQELKREIAELKAQRQSEELQARSQAQLRAEESILTRKHFQDPRFTEEVKAIWENSPGLQAMAQTLPDEALEAAYIKACRKMGVTPDLGTENSLGGRASGGRPVVQRSAEGGERSFEEWKQYLGAAERGSEEFSKRYQEMQQAVKEGRVK